MTTTSIPLDYALTPVRKPVMPRGAVTLVSFLLAGLPSLLLCGRRRIRLVLVLNGLILAAAPILYLAWPLIIVDEDYAGWLWVPVALLVDLIGMFFGLRDRRELILTGTPQAASTSQWMSLFWVAAAGAGVAIGAGVPLAVLCFAFGSARDPCVAFAAVLVLGALVLFGAVISVVCWIREVRK